jgi:hypothetical protein
MRSLQYLAVALIATTLTACAARPTEVTTTDLNVRDSLRRPGNTHQ